MGFEQTNFDTPIYDEESLEPKKAFIISCEGKNTEPAYFDTIKVKLTEYIDALIEIEIVPKLSGGSAPSNVVSDLQNYIKEKYDYQKGYDEFWIVIDREKQRTRRDNIERIMPFCKDNDINIALVNPVFEFWLLLHIVDISKYDTDDLHKNKKVSNKKRFLDAELTTILGSYSKKEGKFPKDIVTIENIQRAIEQEKFFENDLEKIIDSLGSNVGKLVQKIVNI